MTEPMTPEERAKRAWDQWYLMITSGDPPRNVEQARLLDKEARIYQDVAEVGHSFLASEIRAAVQAERERCAKMADRWRTPPLPDNVADETRRQWQLTRDTAAKEIAAAIRAGEHEKEGG